MRIRKLLRIPRLPLAGLDGVSIQRLGRAGAAELKAFTFGAGATTKPHDHAHTHLVLVLAGSGAVLSGATTQPIETGDVVATEPHEVHGFMAAPDLDLRSCVSIRRWNRTVRAHRHHGCIPPIRWK